MYILFWYMKQKKWFSQTYSPYNHPLHIKTFPYYFKPQAIHALADLPFGILFEYTMVFPIYIYKKNHLAQKDLWAKIRKAKKTYKVKKKINFTRS